MKKTICIAAALLSSHFLFAQVSSLFIKGGLNIANVTTTNDGNIDDANSIASFQVGLLADLPLSKFVAIQPSLLFTGKGAKTQSGQTTDASYFRATTNPYYIEVPVNLVFKIPLEVAESSVFIGAGPYIAMGIAGKNKVDGKIFGAAFSNDENIKWSNDDPATLDEQEGAGLGIMRRFDYGVNATAGIQLRTVLIAVNYGLGLAKLQSDSNSSSNDNNKNRVLSVSLGFKL